MLPVIPKPPISKAQKRAALSVAAGVDLLQVLFPFILGEGFLSPFQDALDVMAAIVLVAICGFKWQFAAAFFLELVPVVDIFPTWTALVLTLPSHSEEPHQDVAASVPPRQDRGVIDVDAIVVPPVKFQSGNQAS